MGEKEIRIETSLTPELYEKFLKLKECYGFKHNANVLRVLIVEAS